MPGAQARGGRVGSEREERERDTACAAALTKRKGNYAFGVLATDFRWSCGSSHRSDPDSLEPVSEFYSCGAGRAVAAAAASKQRDGNVLSGWERVDMQVIGLSKRLPVRRMRSRRRIRSKGGRWPALGPGLQMQDRLGRERSEASWILRRGRGESGVPLQGREQMPTVRSTTGTINWQWPGESSRDRARKENRHSPIGVSRADVGRGDCMLRVEGLKGPRGERGRRRGRLGRPSDGSVRCS